MGFLVAVASVVVVSEHVQLAIVDLHVPLVIVASKEVVSAVVVVLHFLVRVLIVCAIEFLSLLVILIVVIVLVVLIVAAASVLVFADVFAILLVELFQVLFRAFLVLALDLEGI